MRWFWAWPPARHCTNDACNWAKVRWGVSHFYRRSQCKARLWQQIKIYKCISKYIRKIYYSGHNSWRSTMLAGHLLSASNNLRWQQTYCLSAFLGRPCGWWLYLAPTPPLTAWRSCSLLSRLTKVKKQRGKQHEKDWKGDQIIPNKLNKSSPCVSCSTALLSGSGSCALGSSAGIKGETTMAPLPSAVVPADHVKATTAVF